MIEIEFNEPRVSACDCCGGPITRLTRFVSQNGDAFAIYYAMFSNRHTPRLVRTIIGIGEWPGWETDEAVPAARVAFAMELRVGTDNYEVSVIDAAESPWSHVELLGKKLTREEALAHPWIKDAFHIADHMIADDQPLKAYLDDEPDKKRQ